MLQENVIWIVIACLSLWAITPILVAIRAFIQMKRGELSEMPESYRFLIGSVSMGQDALGRLQKPFGKEEADLAKLAELTKNLREEDQQTD